MNSPSLSKLGETKSLFWFRWLLTFAWAALIFSFSSQTFGASFTAILLSEILRFLHISVTPHSFNLLHFLLRKSAHMTEYAIFSVFLYHCFLSSNRTEWRTQAAAWAVIVSGLYSLTDEFHQSFVPGRTASIIDCGIDTTGAILGTLLILLWARLFQSRLAQGATVESFTAHSK